MSTNGELAEIFRSIADLLDLQGERFKPEAYRRAARSIESLPEDIRKVADRGGLDQIPGVVRWTRPDGMGVQFGLLGARETHAITELTKEP